MELSRTLYLICHTTYLSGQAGELHYPEAVFRRREEEPGEDEEGVQSELSPQPDNERRKSSYISFPSIIIALRPPEMVSDFYEAQE